MLKLGPQDKSAIEIMMEEQNIDKSMNMELDPHLLFMNASRSMVTRKILTSLGTFF